MSEPTEPQLSLLPIGDPVEPHRDRCVREAIAAHTFARGIPAGDLQAAIWGLDAEAIATEYGRSGRRS